jgi:hypothetical protein
LGNIARILKLILYHYSVRHINTMIPILEERMRHLGEREGKEMAVNEDVGWDSAHDVVGANNLSRRSEVLSPMRHALTGRMVSHSSSRLHFVTMS